MELIPLIQIKNRKIQREQKYTQYELNFDNLKEIYILDLDGIEKNKPNLCTYQKLTKKTELWIDSGPRNEGDIVDNLMAGAEKITIRKNTWPNVDITHITEITENPIYLEIKIQEINNINIQNLENELYNGIIIINTENTDENAILYSNYIKKITLKFNIYYYDKNPTNQQLLEKIGIKGLLIDIDKMAEQT